ncbi:lysylphosphatidylglycerol synthase transmembrane domain-containing protein [Actinoplanes couchii]|uniref:Integral membrane protein-like protein n=1 Tax=Actinoplanes couchii TaxID=403638 RepID=A0ABQ3XL21_9ACTN|nr:YbhN family protein [Actinoplanes couchii]MDR6318420.1 uncharacterized protein (TIRG00374 family) [Actinoplanes couchii]GID59214.1 hypothetical protein Aco03nite_076180 [Actinoplanes couchii]
MEPEPKPPRQWLRPALLTTTILVAGFALHDRVPDPDTVLTVIDQADPWWFAAAVLAQILSQTVFAGQQWAVLAALGTRIPARSMLAVSSSRSAISMALPAGSAASAAFAIRQYARHGAGTAVATAATLLSGLASLIGLALLYLFSVGNAVVAIAMMATVPIAAVLMRGRHHDRPTRKLPRFLDRIADQLHQAIAAVRALRIRDRATAVGLAALNWLLDMACLVAVTHACGAPLTWQQTATVYLTVQIVRQIPLTPGGIGLVEAGLLAGLVTAGTPESTAAVVVLGYRLLSFWLILPTGAIAYLALTRRPGTTRASQRRCLPHRSRTIRRSPRPLRPHNRRSSEQR